MAYTSFTLRKTTVGNGSYLRQTGATDSSLRADGISEIALTPTGQSTFSANIITASTVRLEWSLEIPLVLESTLVGGSVAAPVELRIVSSSRGEPVTIADGIAVGSPIIASTLDLYRDHTPEVIPGRWVYYSLFIKYSNGTDYWFNRAATLYIQIPIEYGSTEAMWKRIPEYYRTLDEEQPTLQGGYTPLYSFLELFGNELNRTRTLIDSIALSNDPEIAVTPALEQLAYETGLEIGINELGTAKARSLMTNIGTLRQRKGTIGSIVSYIAGMTGCGASYEFKSGASAPHIFHVEAQRINFISDPRFKNSTTTYTQGAVNNGTTNFNVTLTTTSRWGVYSYTTTAFPAASASPHVTAVPFRDGILISTDADWGTNTVLVYPRVPYPIVANQTYFCSFDTASSAGASFSNVYTATNSTRTSWESGASAGTMPASLFRDSAWNTGPVSLPQDSTSRRVFQYNPQAGASFSTVSGVPVLAFTMPSNSQVYVGRWLWESKVANDYFDGSTRDGGYIPSAASASSPGAGLFDYFWGDSGVNLDYSYYLMDRQRSMTTTQRVLSNYVVPVTMVNKFVLDWNWYPGKP